MKYVKAYIRNILIAIDQFFFALIGGDPDETWSSAAWKLYLKKGIAWPYKLIDKFFYNGHCRNSYEPDEGKYSLWNLEK